MKHDKDVIQKLLLDKKKESPSSVLDVPIICLTSTAGASAVVPCPSAIAAGTAIINPEMDAITALKNI
jgi:hypothetical protein